MEVLGSSSHENSRATDRIQQWISSMRAFIIEPGTTERLGALIARAGIAQYGPTPSLRPRRQPPIGRCDLPTLGTLPGGAIEAPGEEGPGGCSTHYKAHSMSSILKRRTVMAERISLRGRRNDLCLTR